MKTLKEVELYLATLIPRSRSMGDRLAHVTELLRKLGDPQNSMPAIHIAGTSGKGSTAYYASSLLHEAGYSVGLMVSPHVSKVSERAQVNGSPLPDDEFCAYISEFREIIESLKETVTYIEFLTCFAYWLFAKLHLDYMVIEVGLGGRLDATNTITRKDTVRVITDIGLDHTEILGTTLDAIAAEKAGIIHVNDTVYMYAQAPFIMQSVEAAVKKNSATLKTIEPVKALPYEPIGFQLRNWQLAKQAVNGRLALDGRPAVTSAELHAAASITIPGRFETMRNESETIVLDAAHNPQKITAFTRTLRATFPDKPIIAVVAFGKNKQATVKESIQILASVVDEITFTEFYVEGDDSHQAISSGELYKIGQQSGVKVMRTSNPQAALQDARKRADTAIVAVTGSFYLISNVRDQLMMEFGRTR